MSYINNVLNLYLNLRFNILECFSVFQLFVLCIFEHIYCVIWSQHSHQTADTNKTCVKRQLFAHNSP